MQILNDKEEKEQQRIAKVKEGIKFILSHFEGRQSLFPRKMSTALSQGRQFTVCNEEQILNECIKANFIDCRLNAYPVLFEDDISARIQAPNIIFIDIDLSQGLEVNCEHSLIELNKILNNTLEIIKNKLNGSTPTVLWTGNGYHIYIVLNTRPLELITDLAELSKEPSKEFLKYAEITFPNHKSDPKHNPSFRSYLLRISYTFNSKCCANGKDPEVKIVQKFNPSIIPIINTSLLHDFRLYLADLDIANEKEALAQRQVRGIGGEHRYSSTSHIVPESYLWIEKLLHTPINDHRKYTLELILAPYLIVIKHQSYDEAYSIIKKWALKCNTLKRLRPSLNSFIDHRMKVAIEKSIQNSIPPIRIEIIMKKYPAWYNDFTQWQIFS